MENIKIYLYWFLPDSRRTFFSKDIDFPIFALIKDLSGWPILCQWLKFQFCINGLHVESTLKPEIKLIASFATGIVLKFFINHENTILNVRDTLSTGVTILNSQEVEKKVIQKLETSPFWQEVK